MLLVLKRHNTLIDTVYQKDSYFVNVKRTNTIGYIGNALASTTMYNSQRATELG